MTFECQACFTLFTEHAAEKDIYRKPICPSCGYKELKVVSKEASNETTK